MTSEAQDARGSDGVEAVVLIVEDPVNAAFLVAEASGRAGRGASGAPALGAPERAAHGTVRVGALDSDGSVAARRIWYWVIE